MNNNTASSRMRRSLSQLSLAFAVVGCCFSMLVLSPDGRFAGFSLMALSGMVPIVIGPAGLRKYGVLAAAVGTAGIMFFAGSGEGSALRTKARLQAVYEHGTRYCEASADHRLRTGSWPAGIAVLNVRKPPRTVRSASFGPDGTITLVLSFPPVKDGALVLAPSEADGRIAWACTGRGIEASFLPAACRQESP